MAHPRTHSEIISAAGGVPAVRRALASRGHDLPDPTVRSWLNRNSIPRTYWADFNAVGFATEAELAGAFAKAPVHPAPVSFPASSALIGAQPFTMPLSPLAHPLSQIPDVVHTDKGRMLVGQPTGESAVAV